MAKGSQLSQLKSALSQAGLSKPQQNGKKRKRTPLDEKEKERKAAKLREIQQKMNPFDVKVTKLKHDVGGRKIAGVMGRPAQSKQAGIEQRKKTLLKEYEERDRAGGIVDRRFGENDPTMSLEERMLERFTREKQRASKGAAFNLEDEDELTHYGQSLSKLDDFDNVGLGLDEDEEEDEGQIDSRTVQRAHFGGFEDDEEEDDEEGQPERKKSKAEVMAEVIAKSKEHKFMRQQQQEEDENLRHQLDAELSDLRSLLYAPDPSSDPKLAEKVEEDAPKPVPLSSVVQEQPQDQEYDQFVRELAFEARAKPKDRTKTEEELALEEKEALEKAERKRLRRMRGEEDDSDEEDEDGGRKGRKRQRGGDDLDDDFVDEEGEYGGLLGAGLGEQSADEEEDEGESEEEGEEEEDGESSEEEEGEDDGEEATFSDMPDSEAEDAGEEGDEEELVKVKKSRKSKKTSASSGKKELPYTFPCPETHDEFLEIVEDIDDADVPTVVKRIRTLHHPSLAEDNKFKLQALTGVLVEHILYITSPPSPRFPLVSPLVSHLYALTKQYPIQSAHHFISKLNLMQKNLKRGLSHGVTEPDSRTWPGLPELSFLRVLGLVWPTSDMNHHVVSPARLLMGSYLGLCRVRSLQDVTSGLFLCTLFLQYEELSKRLVPEAINFLENTLLHLAPHRFKDEAALPGSFPAPDFKSERCQGLVLGKKSRQLDVQKPDLTKLLCGNAAGEQVKVDLLGLTLDLLGQYADMYKSLDAFIELYEPIVALLEGVKVDSLPSSLSTKLSSLQDTIGRLLKFSRQSRRPLALQAHKPIPIPTYIPRFEHTTSNYLRNRDPDHERNEAAKIKAQYKQERKGAIRELRKDARFLAAEQQRKQKEKDREYNERMKRVFSSLESERAEQKAMEKEKAKEKKRAGRK